VFDWQRDVLPVIRATYALMEERGEDVLDWEDLGPRLTRERTEGELYTSSSRSSGAGSGRPFCGRHEHRNGSAHRRVCSSHTDGRHQDRAKVEALLRLLDAMINAPDIRRRSEPDCSGYERLPVT